jgi:hypothetical protein
MAVGTTDTLSRYLAPLPRRIEPVAVRYAWVIVTASRADYFDPSET